MTKKRFDLTIELPNREEDKRPWYEEVVQDAQERISIFAKNHHWDEHVTTPLVKKVHVFDSKEQFDDKVKEALDVDPEVELPLTVSGIVINGTLTVVTPEIYAANYKAGQEERAYEKLLAHEMAHELHIRILHGEEDLMGPRWFFEGFALYAANQFSETTLNLTDENIQEIVTSDKSVTYAYYRLLMDELLRHINLNEAVEHAKKADFEDKVKNVLKV
ncbi:hypothetical protein E3U55_06285 [Filobacillus milosensis]|uniref:Uncharacterized protein n=1 Tax=Filobacillus milosensis TaxID=94137 RepID=A0A4Y8IS67_9BACI|nr:hypothetical protein [Filobacillus milosensis]TFB22842.1 hypothetical protein E3U55_06285 [Filobacillus milosensis]